MARARVEITATNNIQKGLNASKKQLSGYQQYVMQMGDKIKKALSFTAIATAAVAGIKTITNACKQCVSAFSEAEKVSSRLKAVWENVGTATGKTAKQMDDYAESMEKVTYFSSESIKEAGLLLAATESLTEDGFDRALQASMDLAAALGEDVASAAQTLSKAIQEPESALSRLKTIGVSFTEDEKAQIKALTDANKQYEAQALILDKVEQRYKGVAQAIADTPVGKLDAIRDTWGDIKETIGQGIVEALDPAFTFILNMLQRIHRWAQDHLDQGNFWKAATAGNGHSLAQNYSQDFIIERQTEALQDVSDALDMLRSDKWGQILEENFDMALQDILLLDRNYVMNQMKKDASIIFGENYESFIGTAEGFFERVTDQYDPLVGTLEAINSALDEYSDLVSIDKPTYTASGSSSSTSTTESALGSFLKTYGNASIEFQRKALNASIAQATALRDALEEATAEQAKQILEEAGFSGSSNSAIRILNEILADLSNKIEALDETIEETTTNPSAGLSLDDMRTKWGLLAAADSEQLNAAKQAVWDEATSNFGQAGQLISELAQNMATMGPVIGAIVTALKYVIEGLAETIGPLLEDVVAYGLEPLREIGRVIGDLIKPLLEELMPLFKDSAESFISVINEIGAALKPVISLIATAIRPILDQLRNTLKFIEPVIKVISKVLVSFTGVIEYIGQVLTHWVATFLNWLAGLNLFGWKPFEGLRITDPGAPGNFSEFMDKRYSSIESAGESATMGTSSQLAVSSASYRGATSVTINIYQEGPLVGDGGMRQFAQMIREEFDALNYYGVSA